MKFGWMLAILLLAAVSGSAQGVEVEVLAEFSAGLHFPTDLAVDVRGNAYVVDGLNQRVVIVSKDGQQTGEIKHPGLRNPIGIDVKDDDVFVSDPAAGAIFRFNTAGLLVERLSMPAGCDPVDVLALDDKLVVSDNDNHRLLFLSYEGALLKVIGRGGSEIRPMGSLEGMALPVGAAGDRIEEFKYPGILSRHKKAFMAIDVLNGRVQAFTTLGNFDRMIGSFGAGQESLFRPKGACACWTGSGTLITDSYSGLVHSFDEYAESQGVLLKGGEPWRLEGPTAIICCGDVWWIVDCRGSRVLRFRVAS